MLTDQTNFLRFIDHTNEFQPDEFHNFLEEFDINQADFLAWIEHNQAPWQYFHFYALLVKNYLNDQQSIQPIIEFAFSNFTPFILAMRSKALVLVISHPKP